MPYTFIFVQFKLIFAKNLKVGIFSDVLIRMEVIDLEQPVNSARWGLGEKVDDDEENNNEVLSCGSSPKKSPTKEQKKTVSDAIGNDEIQEWMVHIVDTFNRESMIRFERGEISDKNPISVKGTRDLEDGFVIGLTIRVSLSFCLEKIKKCLII